MGRNVLNLTKPEVKQIWMHAASKITLMIVHIEDDEAVCVLLNECGTASALQVMVPLEKFRYYGNRGLRLVGKRKGAVPKVHAGMGLYNPRLQNLGAL